ncbi:phosphoenolpyruvate carboxylase [Winogradskyella maritima]|uniref:Phosphoenolpyruvate carboxylase n=1 Tax=Winogradskyella maritima TaxID=1517766 RepID=A0ABV8AHF6_9FLAO|nr:phosphoenolpyruvate carboxylase [Winogradskyella maritima]
MSQEPKLKRFNQNVLSKYQIYNSIFMTLPFDSLSKTVALLPLFYETCKKGFDNNDDPTTIVDTFFKKYQARRSSQSQINLLFRFIQYIERQVVLFDAVEDAAFSIVNNMEGIGTLRNLKESAQAENKKHLLQEYLEAFKVRIVLTAHPTQFYPGSVLGIITDLAKAIKEDNLIEIRSLLGQLGKTPFFKEKKPTPYDEAVNLIWYLKNVFYKSFGSIYDYVQYNIFDEKNTSNPIINVGFWPGGDRDGNPFVTSQITLDVAQKLKEAILKNYIADIKYLKRRLTFKGIEHRVAELNEKLVDALLNPDRSDHLSLDDFRSELMGIRETLIREHQSLFVDNVTSLINKTTLFGYHFASLDIRQDSRVHDAMFTALVKELIDNGSDLFPEDFFQLTIKEQCKHLSEISGTISGITFKNEDAVKMIDTVKAMKSIQQKNGEIACNRYIISNNQSTLNVLQLYAMLKIIAFNDELTADVVPLFETVTDLEASPKVMGELYANPNYRQHLQRRDNKQTIMLGFSDGTKDGGYLMANWAIYKAKEALTKLSRANGIEVIFFDGRGGPPARGGGKTHQFYASLGPQIEDKEIQLTIQGQTISSNFGTVDSSRYNMEQLISSGISNHLNTNALSITESDRKVMNDLANISYKAYVDFKSHPKFLSYLEHMSTLKYYAKTNIGSRPSKRGKSDGLVFSDLRAIPFVGSWSQLKQNVPGFFGVGTALQYYEDHNKFEDVQQLFQSSRFFRTLIANSMMSLSKSFFDLTRYMSEDEEYGEFWQLIHAEYERSKRLILKLTGFENLMQDEPVSKASIHVREQIVLPLLTIQQYALKKIQALEKEHPKDKEQIAIFEKMVTRSLFGNINASRNSA